MINKPKNPNRKYGNPEPPMMSEPGVDEILDRIWNNRTTIEKNFYKETSSQLEQKQSGRGKVPAG